MPLLTSIIIEDREELARDYKEISSYTLLLETPFSVQLLNAALDFGYA